MIHESCYNTNTNRYRMSHGTYMNESRHASHPHQSMAHIWMIHESWHTHEWVTAHTWMSHGTPATHIKVWHTYEWSMRHYKIQISIYTSNLYLSTTFVFIPHICIHTSHLYLYSTFVFVHHIYIYKSNLYVYITFILRPDLMNHINTFKGLPLKYALWELVPNWYKMFPPDRLGRTDMEMLTGLSNKPVPYHLVRRIRSWSIWSSAQEFWYLYWRISKIWLVWCLNIYLYSLTTHGSFISATWWPCHHVDVVIWGGYD